MDLSFKIFFSVAVIALVGCFVAIFYTAQWESRCREQGGVPVKGLCLKVDPSSVIKVVQ